MTEEQKEEYNKCRNSPYYFMTKYMTVNGKPFTTELTEEEFNKKVKIYKELTKDFVVVKGRSAAMSFLGVDKITTDTRSIKFKRIRKKRS